MFFITSFIAAFAGLVLAAMAALMPDTGVNGTPGAILTLAGAAAVTLILAILQMIKPPSRLRLAFSAIMIILAVLTSLAAWFLMQNGIVIAMAVAVLAFLAHGNATQKSALS